MTALSLGDLQTFFLAEKNRSGEKIELPGVKLPGEAVTSWGIAILLAVEAYFFLMYREFVRLLTPEDKAWTVPWLGLLLDATSQTAFAISMLIVPLTVGYVTWRGIHFVFDSWGQLIYAVPLVLAIIITVAVLLVRFSCVSMRKTTSEAG